MLKYATIEKILEVRSSPQRLGYSYGDDANAGLSKFAALDKDLREDDGYLYVRCRAISSRVNKNNDGWPSQELAKAYKSFVGRPVFVDHNNDDPKRTRGVIVSSDLHVEDDEKTSRLDPYYATAPDNHKPPTWIELLIEVDAKTFPRLAKSIRKGDIDAVSMGANIDKSVCSVCAKEASTPSEYCEHIKKKGITFEITSDNGKKVRKKAYEDCYGVNFFEISFVFDPADTTALISEKQGKVAEQFSPDDYPSGSLENKLFGGKGHCPQCGQELGMLNNGQYHCANCGYIGGSRAEDKMAAANPLDFFVEPVGAEHSTGDRNHIPQSEQITAPQHVDTLRAETRCPVCHAADMTTDPDGIERCPVCGHVQEPEPLNSPDLGQARDTDLRQDVTDTTDPDGNRQVPVDDGTDSVEFAPMSPVAPVGPTARKATSAGEGISDMFETVLKTESKSEADAVLPAKVGRVETTLGGDAGIHIGTYNAIKEAGKTARIVFPEIPHTNNFVEVPQDAPLFAYFMTEESAMRKRTKFSEVPIVIEAASQDDADKVAEIIREHAQSQPLREAATNKKTPVTTDKQTDEPKDAKIISDEHAPRESAVKLADGRLLLELDGKKYRLSPVDEVEEETDESEEVEEDADESEVESKKEADRRHIVRSEQNADGVVRTEEIVEESDSPSTETEQVEEPVAQEVEREPAFAANEKSKEATLLAAMKIADESVELGLIESDSKMAFIAELEEESDEALEARRDTLARVKQAGLAKKQSKTGFKINKLPRFAHTVQSNGHGSPDNIPDEAIFLG
jgi:hypothetical protein